MRPRRIASGRCSLTHMPPQALAALALAADCWPAARVREPIECDPASCTCAVAARQAQSRVRRTRAACNASCWRLQASPRLPGGCRNRSPRGGGGGGQGGAAACMQRNACHKPQAASNAHGMWHATHTAPAPRKEVCSWLTLGPKVVGSNAVGESLAHALACKFFPLAYSIPPSVLHVDSGNRHESPTLINAMTTPWHPSPPLFSPAGRARSRPSAPQPLIGSCQTSPTYTNKRMNSDVSVNLLLRLL